MERERYATTKPLDVTRHSNQFAATVQVREFRRAKTTPWLLHLQKRRQGAGRSKEASVNVKYKSGRNPMRKSWLCICVLTVALAGGTTQALAACNPGNKNCVMGSRTAPKPCKQCKIDAGGGCSGPAGTICGNVDQTLGTKMSTGLHKPVQSYNPPGSHVGSFGGSGRK